VARTAIGRTARRFGTVLCGVLLITQILLPTVSALASGSPSISSDKPDYAPGDTVTLTGAGWADSEAVHLFVNDDQSQTWSWSDDVTTDSTGTFTDSFQLPGWFVATYKVTATGALSGMATTAFTDANLTLDSSPPSVNYSVTWSKYNSNGTCSGTAQSGPTAAAISGAGTSL